MKSLVEFIAESFKGDFEKKMEFQEFFNFWASKKGYKMWTDKKNPDDIQIDDDKFWKDFEKCEPKTINDDELSAKDLENLYLNIYPDREMIIHVTELNKNDWDYRIEDTKKPKSDYNLQFTYKENIFK
ncbi:MAG: hypothetical protein J1F35_05960 [Erysipelotrichales bacterium]|nr:hypothetical protein [Erysipelotrichales bacterium]